MIAIGTTACSDSTSPPQNAQLRFVHAAVGTDAVDFRVLKELLPEEINGMPRTSSDGEKNSAMGFTMSRAEARYETQGTNASIRIEISDAGAMTGMAAMAAFAWASMDVDKESETG